MARPIRSCRIVQRASEDIFYRTSGEPFIQLDQTPEAEEIESESIRPSAENEAK